MTVSKQSALVSSFVLVSCFVFPSVSAAQRRDPLRNGAIAGLVVGTTTGVVLTFGDRGGPLSKQYCENESIGTNCNTSALVTTVIFGGLGAVVGAIIDSHVSSRMIWPVRRWPIDAAPIVRRDRKGMALRLRF